MIKALIFDLDDTLLWDKKSVKESLRMVCIEAEAKTGINHKTFEQTIRKEAASLYASYDTYDFTKKIGINPFEGLWGDFTDKHNIGFRRMHAMIYDYQKKAWTNALNDHDIDSPSLGEALAERYRFHRRTLPFLYEDTLEVLTQLKKDYRLFLLTNGAPTLQDEKLNMTPQLPGFFEYILVSGAFGVGKPDPSIFHHTLQLLSATADEAVMIGDNLHTDILGSNRAGIKNIWLNRENKQPDSGIPYTWEASRLSDIPSLLQSR
ncbi:putative hydrolase of the HAD superfamily [Alteribacillus persepolensis]|uniref:Phosphoserine phosphatase n=1 Tax=Alteribacillus persepolensis TaxID=568899 RepID=A0A1G7Z909_9BACI|nr:HAD family hydrolase [Alteribacillus persepolensis]SDH05006.1 putative hydrolase of the HAD superfamily [Alteribacillus persepolensis]